jgi:uncharacterized protein (DUF1330 family)
MSAFMLVEITVKDQAMYDQYMERIPSVIEKHRGRYIVRSSKVTPNSGGWMPDRIILVEFDDLADLRACFRSAEYAELAPMRERATTTRSVVIES